MYHHTKIVLWFKAHSSDLRAHINWLESRGFKHFDEYGQSNFGFSKRTINERIQLAKTFGEEYELASLGHRKMKGLATMPVE